MPCSPRRRIRIVTVAERIDGQVAPGWAGFASAQLDISNGCQDHTVLPYANSVVRPARCRSLTEDRPANNRRADAVASTASSPAFVTMANAPLAGKGRGELVALICPTG